MNLILRPRSVSGSQLGANLGPINWHLPLYAALHFFNAATHLSSQVDLVCETVPDGQEKFFRVTLPYLSVHLTSLQPVMEITVIKNIGINFIKPKISFSDISRKSGFNP